VESDWRVGAGLPHSSTTDVMRAWASSHTQWAYNGPQLFSSGLPMGHKLDTWLVRCAPKCFCGLHTNTLVDRDLDLNSSRSCLHTQREDNSKIIHSKKEGEDDSPCLYITSSLICKTRGGCRTKLKRGKLCDLYHL
jgi:hypothetical protein